MPRYRVAIFGETYEAMIDLVKIHQITVLDHGSRRLTEHLFRAYAILEPEQIDKLQAEGYKVERFEDVDETAKLRRQDIGVGDRYRDRGHDQEKDWRS